MARKRKLLSSDPEGDAALDENGFGDDHDEYDDGPSSSDPVDCSLDEDDIGGICGPVNAQRGLALFLQGAVDKRVFDGRAIRAHVAADAAVVDVAYDFDALTYRCSAPADARARDRACAHVAALQYAWLRRPESFELANLGAALELYTRRPELFAGSELNPAFLQSIVAVWESAPPELRNKIARTPAYSTPEQLAALEAELQVFAEQARAQEFAELLGCLTLEQLREISKRRHWTPRVAAKAKAVAELIEHLRASPLPDSFSPEEEQLVRIENTLWGIEGMPSHQHLLADWQAHAGGNLARLEQALQGLQHAGVLFPCSREGLDLHYHWSPYLRADMLPLLQPNVALAPAKGAQLLSALPAALRLLNLMDAVLSFAEREPLRLSVPARDPRLAGHSQLGAWPYLLEEAKGLTEPRGKARQGLVALSVPFQPFFADETLDALGALAGEGNVSGIPRDGGAASPSANAEGRGVSAASLRDYGAWAATMLLQAEVIRLAPEAEGPVGSERSEGLSAKRSPVARPAAKVLVNPAAVAAWHMLAPDQQLERLWKLWCAGASTFGDFRAAFQDTEFVVRRSLFAPDFTPQTLAAEMGLARQFVARVLAMLSPQTWYAWPALAACIRRLRSSFLYTFTSPEWWWIEHAPSARRYDASNPQQWEAAWLPLLQTMLTGPLCWFGAIELNTSRSAFRITPLGAWLFTNGRQGHVPSFAAAVAEEGPPFQWLDETTFCARATPEAMRALAPLRVYADPSRELLTFRVSMPAIGRALANGAAAPAIAETFAAAGLPLPSAVQQRIETLVERTGRLNLYERVTVLELGDDITLRELLATTALRAYIVHEFSPRLVVVRDEAVEALLAELVKKGHTPRLT